MTRKRSNSGSTGGGSGEDPKIKRRHFETIAKLVEAAGKGAGTEEFSLTPACEGSRIPAVFFWT